MRNVKEGIRKTYVFIRWGDKLRTLAALNVDKRFVDSVFDLHLGSYL